MWNYAKLSRLAKALGGPDKLVQTLINSGVKKGRWQMVALLPLAAVLGYAINPLIDYLKQKRATSQAALESAKQELIQGIIDYDKAQMKEETDNE